METPQQSFVDALHEAHADLLGDLKQLEVAIGADAGQSPAEVSARLERLLKHITDHFRFEEEGGYMAQVLTEEPKFQPTAQELLLEHLKMRQTLEALIPEITEAKAVREAFRKKVRAWIKQLRQHESRENSLIQEAYYSTGATGD
jgi:hemerythrin